MNVTLEGVFLSHTKDVPTTVPFKKVTKVSSHVPMGSNTSLAYVVPSLSADFLLLFPTASVIVTAAGSSLSHLAILAREHGIPVFRADNLSIDTLPESGECTLVEKKTKL